MNKLSKEDLYENFVTTTLRVFSDLGTNFGMQYLEEYVAGVTSSPDFVDMDPESQGIDCWEEAKRNLRETYAWKCLSATYDYAVDGILDVDDPGKMILSAWSILSHLETHDASISTDWTNIAARAAGRHRLDHSNTVSPERLALLGSVDIRTVRNAISAGELVSEKIDSDIHIDAKSARSWLSGRRGFKPTRILVELLGGMTSISTPAELGSFLVSHRKKQSISVDDKELLALHPSLNAKVIKEFEMGVFSLPLDTVPPLADFYQIDRNQFLITIMKVFYEDQHRALTKRPAVEQEESTDD